jgi:hypothetical protein
MSKARDIANAGTALSSVDATELGYLDGVTSAVQTQLNAKQATVSGVNDTEIGYLDGVTSAIQTQLNQKPEFAAGKNKVINGAFDIWQRGTSFTNPTNNTFVADRYSMYIDGSGATRTISQQSFTPGSQPSGFYGQYFFRYAQTVAGTGASVNNGLLSKIENVNTLQNQTVTLSFWMKADASRSVTWATYQQFGSGGSSAVLVNTYTFTATTSWQRFTQTFTMPSLTGKTIGTGSSLTFIISFPLNTVGTYDFTGVQLEAGSTATAFQTATGTIQGELAACQRYYWRYNGSGSYDPVGTGYANSTTAANGYIPIPTVLRTSAISSVDYTNLSVVDGVTIFASTGLTLGASSSSMARLDLTGLSGLTQFRPLAILLANTTNQFLGFSAEL